jgi:hypothetical protein
LLNVDLPASLSLIKSIRVILLFVCVSLFAACGEKRTTDPVEAYQSWSGEKPGKDIQVIHAQYWESAHWTKKYELYLELTASPAWRAAFIAQNHLRKDSAYTLPADKPNWFTATARVKIWKLTAGDPQSVILEDTVSGRLLIYDIQL